MALNDRTVTAMWSPKGNETVIASSGGILKIWLYIFSSSTLLYEQMYLKG